MRQGHLTVESVKNTENNSPRVLKGNNDKTMSLSTRTIRGSKK